MGETGPFGNRFMKRGKVFLVGAGPGDPGLITVRGLQCLREADLVLYDGLVNPLVLRHAHGQLERTARATRCRPGAVSQADVTERMIRAAREGKVVVRLKGGDPFVFGRGGEEAAALAEAGIPFEVVPGITAATAAAVCAGICLTHREDASAVALITGHEDPAKTEPTVDYDILAKFPGTLVFYMGLHRVDAIAAALIQAGKSPTTPVAVVSQTTLPQQQVVSATLETIGPAVRQAALVPPSLIIVGDTVAHRSDIAWFEQRPLHGISIGLTRAEGQLDSVIDEVLKLGGEPVPMPLIEIRPPESWSELDAVLSRIETFDWLIFTSANGVRSFLGRMWETARDARSLGASKLAAIGPSTAAALEKHQLRADVVPAPFRAEELAQALTPHVKGKRVLWVRASRGRDVLPDALVAAGAAFEQVVVYRNDDVEQLPDDARQRLQSGELDWIALSSPSIASNLARLISAAGLKQGDHLTRLAAISPVTASAAKECGLEVAAVADEFTWAGLLDAIIRQSHR
jgi:uroporphyrinogen III methyltransferase / synthase